MINIGIIGVGGMGISHCIGFDRLSECRVVAVADTDKKQLEYSKNAFRMNSPKLFTDYKDILKMSEVNAVVIVTPTYYHTQIAILMNNFL